MSEERKFKVGDLVADIDLNNILKILSIGQRSYEVEDINGMITILEFVKEKDYFFTEKKLINSTLIEGKATLINSRGQFLTAPDLGEEYFVYDTAWNKIENYCYDADKSDNSNIKYGLAYVSREALEKYLKYKEIETQLQKIALELNDGEEINWENEDQVKYFIQLDCMRGKFSLGFNSIVKSKNIYCLSEDFLDVVLKKIGQEDLEFYLEY